MDEEFIKYLQENKDQNSSVEMRMLDTRHNKITYKTLTIKELCLVSAILKIEWHDLPRKEDKINE